MELLSMLIPPSDHPLPAPHPIVSALNCTPRKHQGTIPAAKIMPNAKFAAFLGVFLTKMKVDPDSWCNNLSIKHLRVKKFYFT